MKMISDMAKKTLIVGNSRCAGLIAQGLADHDMPLVISIDKDQESPQLAELDDMARKNRLVKAPARLPIMVVNPANNPMVPENTGLFGITCFFLNCIIPCSFRSQCNLESQCHKLYVTFKVPFESHKLQAITMYKP